MSLKICLGLQVYLQYFPYLRKWSPSSGQHVTLQPTKKNRAPRICHIKAPRMSHIKHFMTY